MDHIQFIPRKLQQNAKLKGSEKRQIEGGPSRTLTQDDQVLPRSTSIDENAANETMRNMASAKGKQKEVVDGKPYARLMSLALSDYSIWRDDAIQDGLNSSDEGFLSISFLLDKSSIFAGINSHPPESIIAQALKNSDGLEIRMSLLQPDATGWKAETNQFREGRSVGGYEVRRRGWDVLKERIRKYTSFQWEEKTIYVENLPINARTIPSIQEFIISIAAGPSASTNRQLLQYIFLPRHHNDLEGTSPVKCKGFAFVVFTQASDARAFTEMWPWEPRTTREQKDEAQLVSQEIVIEARSCGFHSLTKRRWEALKEEYLALQARLFAQVVKSSQAKKNTRNILKSNSDETNFPVEGFEVGDEPRTAPDHQIAAQDVTQYSYPPNCLIFVKNIHPETNKTTLRALIAKAFNGSSEEIDYVDYNKGLDSCYIRLRSPASARTLVRYFTDNAMYQSSGLDSDGNSSIGVSSRSIEVELIQDTKERVYWEKVPEKIRRQALANAYPEHFVGDGLKDSMTSNDQRKTKRRRVG